MKKGFVVSAVLYPLLVITLTLIMSVIAMSDNRRKILDNLKLEVMEEDVADPEMSNSTLYYKMLALEEAYAEMNARVSEERFEELEEKIKAVKLESFPVGSIFVSIENKNPSTFIGGTWEAFGTGRTLVGVDTSQTEFATVGKTGGEKTHTLTIAEMPSHTHQSYFMNIGGNSGSEFNWGSSINRQYTWQTTKATGGSQAHNNMPPYITVYFWKRTA